MSKGQSPGQVGMLRPQSVNFRFASPMRPSTTRKLRNLCAVVSAALTRANLPVTMPRPAGDR